MVGSKFLKSLFDGGKTRHDLLYMIGFMLICGLFFGGTELNNEST